MGMMEEIGAYIAAELPSAWSVGYTLNSTLGAIYFSELPVDPPQALSLYQMPGKPPQYTLGAVHQWVNPRLQVINRNPTLQDAYVDAQSIYNLLKNITGVSLSGTQYIAVRPVGVPAELGPDSGQRQRVVANYDVMKLES